MSAATMANPTVAPISGYRMLGWGASALLHGGAVALLVFGLPYAAAPPPPVPEIIPLEMAVLPTAPAEAEAEPTPAMETTQAVAPEATSATTAPPPPLAMTVPEPPTTTQPPPPETLAATPPAELAPPPSPETVQAMEPEVQQAAEPEALPLEVADLPPPPPAPPPPPQPVQAVRPPPPRAVAPRREQQQAAAAAPAVPQYSPAPPGPVTAAPSAAAAPTAAPGRAAGPPVDYIGRLSAALSRAKRYPQRARLARIEGVPHVRFSFRRDGTVVNWTLARSSGNDDLDQAAGEMVLRASPLPAPPADYQPGEIVTMTVPVNFNLN